METPSLSELLRWDFRKGNLRNEGYEHRRLDGNPLYWRYMRSKLLALDDFTLSMLVLKVRRFPVTMYIITSFLMIKHVECLTCR